MINTHKVKNAEARETSRIEAFSDGVFAIAITLLILNIRPPEEATSASDLLTKLAKIWPQYLGFFLSFATIGIMWVNHHRMFRFIKRTDHFLLIFNGLLLMAITFLPFPTELLASYLGSAEQTSAVNVAAMVYNGTSVFIAIFYNLLWWHIAYWGRLMDKDTPPSLIRAITRAYMFGPLLYLIAVGLAAVSVQASLAFSIGLAIYFAVPSKIEVSLSRLARHESVLPPPN